MFSFFGLSRSSSSPAHRSLVRTPMQWTSMGPDTGNVQSIAMNPQDSNTLYTATNAGVFKTTDGGESWNPVNAGLPQVPTTLYAWNAQGLYKTTDGSTSWKAIDPGGYPFASSLVVDPHDSDVVYGFNSNGLMKSTDGAVTWAPANSGFPENWYPRALSPDPLNIGTPYAWSNLYDPTGPKLFKTTDGAANWNPVNSGLQGNQISSLVIDPRNTSNLYVATWGFAASGLQVTAIFASADGGGHWSVLSPALPLQIITYGLALSPLNGKVPCGRPT
jgi:photosystem II stability/assembly factor-like uncharacterized protein